MLLDGQRNRSKAFYFQSTVVAYVTMVTMLFMCLSPVSLWSSDTLRYFPIFYALQKSAMEFVYVHANSG